MDVVRHLVARIAAERPAFVALCGWADTGKSTLAATLCDHLRALGLRADVLSTDAFLQDRAERNRRGLQGYDPASLDAEALAAAIARLAAGSPLDYVPYDNRTGMRVTTARRLLPQDVLIVEGIHAFHPAVLVHAPLRVVLHADEATLKALRARANVVKRGMDPDDARRRIDAEYEAFCRHVLPRLASAEVQVSVDTDHRFLLRG